MTDNRLSGNGLAGSRDSVCIEANRVLDSCRDRDCYENVQVFLTDGGNAIIERTNNVRVKSSCIAWSNITVDPIAFNKGFYSVNIRLYIRVLLEACMGIGGSQEFDGVAVVDKNVILWGGESNLNVFRSNGSTSFCDMPAEAICSEMNTPTAVLEVVDPIILCERVMERRNDCFCNCCCCCNDVPERVLMNMNGPLSDLGSRYLSVSLGIFSTVRLVRPTQYLVSATEYSVPDKECVTPCRENPCDVFKNIPFPTQEFGTGMGNSQTVLARTDKPCGR